MPHLTIEYSANLNPDPHALLTALNETLIQSGHFAEFDIKTRLFPVEYFLIGNQGQRAFAHACLKLMPGRSLEIRADLAQRLSQTLSQQLSHATELHTQFSAEVLELHAPTYSKHFSSNC
ncbi:5-carboxymethyl-2-hydroxymuconate Delta-isomerase [Paenalcaligenes hominis]|uniref:5-carboxymethyl-2-hydroxymuconate Delta-isomerase n=1 Tax=Paenalcaligenes hominis TaxID=643674 RepID=UPI00352544CD